MTDRAPSVCGKTSIRREMGSALAELAWDDGAWEALLMASHALRPRAQFVGSLGRCRAAFP